MDKEKLLPIMQSFCDKKSYGWCLPFIANKKTMATDGYMLVAHPLVIDGLEVNDSRASVIPEKNMDKSILVSTIKGAIDSFPRIERYDKKECRACHGDGQVDYEFYHKKKRYAEKTDCPICEGIGEITSDNPNGKWEFIPDHYMKIGNCIFNPVLIEKALVYLANIENVDEIKVFHQSRRTSANLFVVGDFDVVIMPRIESLLPEEIYKTIEL